MAFTIEEIENALTTEQENTTMFSATKIELSQSVNYPLIVDYLSGKITSIPVLHHDNQIYYWHKLLNLLGDIENMSPDTQLVLDIIFEPTLFAYMRHHLNNWLINYAQLKNTESALQTVIQQFKNQSLPNTDIFLSFVFKHQNENKDLNNKTPIINFLLDYIKKANQIIYSSPVNHTYQNTWSSFYFKLIEEAKPSLALDYALYGIQLNGYNITSFFESYKNGKYVSGIIDNLTDLKNYSLQIIQRKFSTAISFYELNETKYNDLALNLSKQYLNYIQTNNLKQDWEPHKYIKEFEKEKFHYLLYSSIAFHLLFKNEKEKAIETINYWLENKTFIAYETLAIIEYHLKKESLIFIKKALNANIANGGNDYFRNTINLLQKEFNSLEYIPLIWDSISSKSKPIREMAANILATKDPEAEQKAIALLNNKKIEIRQTAALILSKFNSENSRDAILQTLNQESNDNVRDIMLTSVSGMLPNETNSTFVNEMIEAAAKRGKLVKPLETWLDEANLPALFYVDESELPSEAVRFLLYRMSRVKTMQSDIEAKYLIQLLDKEKAAPFAKALIKLFAENGAKPEHKYLLALAALLGNDEIVDYISRTINKWIDESRYKMAEYGVGALAIQGSDKALRKVEWYSRKYKVKKANVGAAALLALETAATELNITIQELGDRVVPDFGFEGLFKTITIDNEEYRAFIDSNFKIAFFNEDNKKLKALPSNASKEIKDELKDIAKEVRDVVKSQSSRLEYYLVIQRRWPIVQWKQFFLENPVMFIYATKLVWGIYDSGENLLATFYCNEDTELMNVEGDEITLPEEGFIGMVHPIQLSPIDLQTWKKLLFDQSIQPIFPQLDRPKADLSGIDMDKPIITKFKDKQTENESIRNILEKRGWNKGPTGDGGMIESYNLLYFEKRIEAILEIEGVGAGYGWGGDQRTGNLYVINKKNVATKWFSSQQNNEDERLVNPKDLPPIFLNEMLAAVEAIKFKTAG